MIIAGKISTEKSIFLYERLQRCIGPLTHPVMVKHSPGNDMLMYIAFSDNPSLLLEENVRSACFGQVGVICACCCQKSSKALADLCGAQEGFYLHAKFNLGSKGRKKVLSSKPPVHTKATKTKPKYEHISKTGIQFFTVYVFCLWRMHIHWVRLVEMHHMGSGDKHHCFSCYTPPPHSTHSSICFGSWPNFIYHKRNKSTHTMNSFPLMCQQFLKDTSCFIYQHQTHPWSNIKPRMDFHWFIFSEF